MNYFYTDETGGVVGPVSREILQKLTDAGMTAPNCQACYEGSEDWQPLTAFVRPTEKAQEKQAFRAPPQHRSFVRPTEKVQEKPLPAKSSPVQAVVAVPSDRRSDVSEPGFTRAQGYAVIALLCIGLCFPFLSFLKPDPPDPQWEYKKLVFLTDKRHDRTGFGALSYSSIQLDESRLESMGSKGWELATSYLEMETAFPNFGKEDYVTGLQPNIRPQSLVLIFKRPK
jgi:hypothetical protein